MAAIGLLHPGDLKSRGGGIPSASEPALNPVTTVVYLNTQSAATEFSAPTTAKRRQFGAQLRNFKAARAALERAFALRDVRQKALDDPLLETLWTNLG